MNLALIFELTKRDFTERFAGSVLGSFWAVIWPLVDLFIYMIIFGQLMGGRLPGDSGIYTYGVYLSVGLIPWKCFSGTVMRSTSVFLDRKNIISKLKVSLPSLLIYINLAEMITCFISCGLLTLFLVVTRYEVHAKILLVPFIFYLQQALALGLGLLAAVLTVFIRDIKEITGVALQFWFWFTPIVYVYDILPELAKNMLGYNPAYIIIEAYHRIMVFNAYPDAGPLLTLAVITHGLMVVAYLVFRYLEKDIRDFL